LLWIGEDAVDDRLAVGAIRIDTTGVGEEVAPPGVGGGEREAVTVGRVVAVGVTTGVGSVAVGFRPPGDPTGLRGAGEQHAAHEERERVAEHVAPSWSRIPPPVLAAFPVRPSSS